jgi:hypothetical protein
MHFYMDESGTRHPDHDQGGRPAHDRDWFGMGGVLINKENETEARDRYSTFTDRWKLGGPLRSAEIRHRSGSFAWLNTAPKEERREFYEALYRLMAGLPLVGSACVIDRPGYNRRYRPMYGSQRWLLCKTAFSIAVERAAKFAKRRGPNSRFFWRKPTARPIKTCGPTTRRCVRRACPSARQV